MDERSKELFALLADPHWRRTKKKLLKPYVKI